MTIAFGVQQYLLQFKSCPIGPLHGYLFFTSNSEFPLSFLCSSFLRYSGAGLMDNRNHDRWVKIILSNRLMIYGLPKRYFSFVYHTKTDGSWTAAVPCRCSLVENPVFDE